MKAARALECHQELQLPPKPKMDFFPPERNAAPCDRSERFRSDRPGARRNRPDFPGPVPGLSTTCGNRTWEVRAAHFGRPGDGQIAIHHILWFGPAEHSPVPAARSQCRRAQRRSRPARFRAAEGLVLTAASTTARWRGTGTADHHYVR